jgi:hypothetical protein
MFKITLRYFRQWELNPVLLFELRQTVRNRLVMGLMLLYLLMTVVICSDQLCGLNLIGNFFVSHSANNAVRLAALVLLSYYVFTTLTLVLFAAVRTASDELQESSALYTLLSPFRIVLGKMLFGGVIVLLFMSMTLPFISTAYLMRGLDVRLIFCGIIMYFFLIQIHYLITIAFFAGAKSYGKVGAAIFVLLFWQSLLAFWGFEIGTLAINIKFLTTIIVISVFSLVIIFLFATTRFAPKTSNYMFPVRVTVTGIQLFLCAIFLTAIIWKIEITEESFFFPFIMNLIYFNFIVPFLFLYCICEPETISTRIKQTIPRSFLKRLLVFPFYTGAANAMVWCALTLFFAGIVTGVLFLFDDFSYRRSDTVLLMCNILSFELLIIDYCATTLLIYNLLLHRWISRSWNWVFPFFLVAVIILFSIFAKQITGLFSLTIIDLNQILDQLPFLPIPISFIEPFYIFRKMSVSIIWFLVLAAISVPWLYRHFKAFRRCADSYSDKNQEVK